MLATLGFALGVALLAVGITGYFHLGRDAQSLRDSVMNSTPRNWEKTIELNVGWLTCGLARTVISCFELAPEARTALQAVRGAEVGVYHLPRRERLANGSAILAAADDMMTARGWDRLVGVIKEGQLVAVYVPKKVRSANAVKLCLVTLKDRDLVVASAQGNLEPLLELAGACQPGKMIRPALSAIGSRDWAF